MSVEHLNMKNPNITHAFLSKYEHTKPTGTSPGWIILDVSSIISRKFRHNARNFPHMSVKFQQTYPTLSNHQSKSRESWNICKCLPQFRLKHVKTALFSLHLLTPLQAFSISETLSVSTYAKKIARMPTFLRDKSQKKAHMENECFLHVHFFFGTLWQLLVPLILEYSHTINIAIENHSS